MIKIKPNMLYVKDPNTGEFKQLLAIKGNPGSISNIADYFVSEAGNSEMLAMTQKGATAIKEELAEDIADTKTELEENINTAKSELAESISNTKTELEGGIDDVVNNKTVATANYANYLYGEEATAAPSRPVWFSDSTYYDKKVYSKQFMYNPGTDTLTVGNITGKAAQADLSAKLSYKLISSLEDLTTLATGGMCYAIILSAAITINDLIFPQNSRGILVSNGTAAFTAVGPDGVTYTAFYDHNQKTWRGTRKSTTCITKLPHYSSPEMIENGGIYPPTADAVQASFQDIYWELSKLSNLISDLSDNLSERISDLEQILN